MNKRTVALQAAVFAIQWVLIIVGFGLLVVEVAPIDLVPQTIPLARLVDAGLKGLIALTLSLVWLFVWDRQVRFLFYGKDK